MLHAYTSDKDSSDTIKFNITESETLLFCSLLSSMKYNITHLHFTRKQSELYPQVQLGSR